MPGLRTPFGVSEASVMKGGDRVRLQVLIAANCDCVARTTARR